MNIPKNAQKGWKENTTLVICCTSVLLVGIDMTAVNVALPTIDKDLQIGFSLLPWIIGAYTLPLAAFLMLSSSLADNLGRKRIFLLGLIIFLLGSALCGLASNFTYLVIARALQGVGASMLNPVAMAILAQTFPATKDRAWAMGIWSGATGLALALGPLVGGLLVNSVLGWRYIFYINIPIGIIAILLTLWIISEKRPEKNQPFDVLGQILMIIFLASLTYALMEGETLGWGAWTIISAIGLACCTLVWFIFHQQKTPYPLLDLAFFRSMPFSLANVIAVLAFASLATFLYLNSLYLQQLRGFSAFRTGIILLPLAICSVIWGPINGRILSRKGSRIPLMVAGFGFTLTGLMLTVTDASTSLIWLALAYGLMGIANAAVGAPITYMAISGMPAAKTSLAAGISSTSRQIGQTLGVAITGMMMSRVQEGNLTSLGSAIIQGWWIMGLYGGMILLLGLVTTRKQRL